MKKILLSIALISSMALFADEDKNGLIKYNESDTYKQITELFSMLFNDSTIFHRNDKPIEFGDYPMVVQVSSLYDYNYDETKIKLLNSYFNGASAISVLYGKNPRSIYGGVIKIENKDVSVTLKYYLDLLGANNFVSEYVGHTDYCFDFILKLNDGRVIEFRAFYDDDVHNIRHILITDDVKRVG